jgi:actin-like ATPase involved in cell morphogenesis
MVQGMVLTGRDALLRGLNARVGAETGIALRIGENPLQSVAVGAQCLEEFNILEGTLISSRSPRFLPRQRD